MSGWLSTVHQPVVKNKESKINKKLLKSVKKKNSFINHHKFVTEVDAPTNAIRSSGTMKQTQLLSYFQKKQTCPSDVVEVNCARQELNQVKDKKELYEVNRLFANNVEFRCCDNRLEDEEALFGTFDESLCPSICFCKNCCKTIRPNKALLQTGFLNVGQPKDSGEHFIYDKKTEKPKETLIQSLACLVDDSINSEDHWELSPCVLSDRLRNITKKVSDKDHNRNYDVLACIFSQELSEESQGVVNTLHQLVSSSKTNDFPTICCTDEQEYNKLCPPSPFKFTEEGESFDLNLTKQSTIENSHSSKYYKKNLLANGLTENNSLCDISDRLPSSLITTEDLLKDMNCELNTPPSEIYVKYIDYIEKHVHS